MNRKWSFNVGYRDFDAGKKKQYKDIKKTISNLFQQNKCHGFDLHNYHYDKKFLQEF